MNRVPLLFLLAALGCAGDDADGTASESGTPASEACEAYLECVAAVSPVDLDAALAAYGDGGSCYDSEVDCDLACQQGSADLKAASNDPACGAEDPAPEEEMEEVVAEHCLGCHGAGQSLVSLDLETDLHGATVDVIGAYGVPIVVPGEPDASLLYLMVTDTQGSNGSAMPLGTGGLEPDDAATVRAWIEGL